MDVLEVGCGHGELALSVARGSGRWSAWSATGDARISPPSCSANPGLAMFASPRPELAGPAEAHRGGPLPLAGRSVDLVIDRRGPPLLHYLDDLRRVARPGCVIIGMHPAGEKYYVRHAPPPYYISASVPGNYKKWDVPLATISSGALPTTQTVTGLESAFGL